MKIVKASQAISFKNAENCYGREASFEGAPMNGALITVNGRYPEEGYITNEVCAELAFVVCGSGKLGTPNELVSFELHDSLFLAPGEKFYWEGDFDIYTICNPAFYPEQHKEIPDEY